MITVIEGVDAAGKTTLAEQLMADTVGATEYVHSGPPKNKDALREYASKLVETDPHCHYVFDRLHWGEMVYGPLYRGESSLTPEMFYWLELLTASRAGGTVLAVDSPDAVFNRVMDLDDDFVHHNVVHLREIQQRFVTLTNRAATEVALHSISAPLNTKAYLISKRYHTNGRSMTEKLYGHYVGPSNPEVLLVGDIMGDPDDSLALPFIPTKTGSGHYLMSALMRTNIWKHVGLTNSLDPEGSPVDFIDNVSIGQRFVALGNDASARLTEAGIPHGKAYHPQYVRRFMNKQVDNYASAIYAAAATGIDTTIGGWFDES